MLFIYSGPMSGVTLQDGDSIREVMLYDGHQVDLPEDHEYTKVLKALGHLAPAPQEPLPARSGGSKQVKEA